MRLSEQLSLSRAPMAALAMVGLFWGGFAGLVPDIKDRAGVSEGELGAVLMMSALGAMTSMYFAPRIFRALGRLTLPIAGAALIAAFLYPLLAHDMASLAVALFAMGATVGLFDISSNIRIGAIEAKHRTSLMNANHAMFSLAFGGAALFTGLSRQAGQGPTEILPIMAVGALCILALTLESRQAWDDPEAEETEARMRPGDRIWPVVSLTAVVLFCSFIGENATEAWSALHIERTLGADVGHGSYGPAVLGFVMFAARMSGQLVADRIGEVRLILGSALLGIVGAILIAAAWAPWVVLVGVAIEAIGMAVIVPSANTVLGRRVPGRLRGLAISRAWMFGMAGFFIGPAMMGGVAELAGLRLAFLFMGAVVAVIIPAIIWLGRIEPLMQRPSEPVAT